MNGMNPGVRYAWYVTLLLALMYVFSFVDRLILGLVAVDVAKDLDLSDTQLGLLIGTSFAIVYSLAGLPLANMLDRQSRKWLVVAGVSVWALCTMAAGFATGFATLALTRLGVAAGEAVLTPAAVSLIADLFPRDRRITPMIAYSAVASVMTVGGLVIGAAALDIAQEVAPRWGLAPWRITLALVGLPPLLLAVLFAITTREPRRGCFDGAPEDEPVLADLRACAAHLRTNLGFYGNFYLASAIFLIFVYGLLTWTPALLVRGYGWSQASAGYAFGVTGIAVGLAGLVVWPRMVVLLKRRGIAHPLPLTIATGCAVAVPAAVQLLLTDTNQFLFIGLGLSIFAATAYGSLSPLVIQQYAPPAMRARFMSLLLLAQSLIGYGLGPSAVALVATGWAGDDRALGYALASVGLVAIPLASFCYWRARRSLIQARNHDV